MAHTSEKIPEGGKRMDRRQFLREVADTALHFKLRLINNFLASEGIRANVKPWKGLFIVSKNIAERSTRIHEALNLFDITEDNVAWTQVWP